MVKRAVVFIFAVLILANIYGCFAVLAGGIAGGIGTGVWLSGKMVQQVDASFEQTTQAVKATLRLSKSSIVMKESVSEGVIQVRSHDASGEKIWIDVHRISEKRSQIQVRVGTFFGNKEASDRMLREILQNL